jgi:hypothetical protein
MDTGFYITMFQQITRIISINGEIHAYKWGAYQYKIPPTPVNEAIN